MRRRQSRASTMQFGMGGEQPELEAATRRPLIFTAPFWVTADT